MLSRAGFDLKGRFRWRILNEDGSPGFGYDQNGRKVHGGHWQKNLITKLGMNRVGTSGGVGRSYLHIGEGALVVSTDSGATTASQAGTTVTASAAIFSAANVGDLVHWDTGESSLITAYTDTTHVEVSKAATVASGLFTIEHTSLQQLVSEVEVGNSNGGFGDVNTYSLDSVNNLIVGEYQTTRVITMAAARNLTEFGFSPDGVATNLNIVELFRDSGGTPITLTIPSGKKLQLDHTLVNSAPWAEVPQSCEIQPYDITDTPLGVTAATNASPIQVTTNFPHGFATGDEVTISGVLGNTAANGVWTITVVDTTNFTLDGSTGNGVYTSGGTISLHVTGTGIPGTWQAAADDWSAYLDRVIRPDDNLYNFNVTNQCVAQTVAYPASPGNFAWNGNNGPFQGPGGTGEVAHAVVVDPYVTDSMQRSKGNTFSTSQANAALYGFAIAWNYSQQAAQGFKFSNPATFTKDSAHTLKIRFLISWWWSF